MFSFFTSLLIQSSLAFDPNTSHSHQGKVRPLTKAPDLIVLDKDQQRRLKKGETVFQRIRMEGSDRGKGVAVQYIHTSAEQVWDTILNYSRYTDWVNNVTSCTVYEKDGENLYTAIISEVLFVEFGIYTQNRIRKQEGYMFWTLDYRKRSDADDLLGYWRVEQIRTEPPLTRVDHSTELLLSGVPDFLLDYLSEDALVHGTQWVKREAERKP
jgi:hypothetical protein